MNIVNKFFLYLVLLPSGFYRKMGVDTRHLEAILNAKLIMDDRRPNSFQQTRFNKQNRTVNAATLGTMFLSALMGLFFLASFVAGKDYITRLSIYFSMYIFVLAASLISDFTSVLLDVRDNMIILPKPVNDRSFVLARLLHIIIHVSKIVFPMTLPGMIYIGYQLGIGAVWPFLLMTLAATLFTIFLINAIYLLILKITTPEKFKNIISYFQIGFAVFLYGSYQVVPRLFGRAFFEDFNIAKAIWAWIFPPYWFASGWSFLFEWHFTVPLVVCFLLSIMVPWGSIWLVVHYFAPSFNRKLALITGSSESTVTVNKKNQAFQQSAGYAGRVAALFTRKGPEHMAFMHAWKMMLRSRDFKMKVYPGFGYVIVLVVVSFMGKKIDLQGLFMMVTYFSSFILNIAIQQLAYSDQYKASWIFVTAPVQKPGQLISGAVKAAIAQFYIPLVTVIFTAAIILIGPAIIPNLLLGLCNMFAFTALLSYIAVKDLPFSQLQSTSARTGSFLRNMLTMFIIGLLALLHFLVYKYLLAVILLLVLSAIASWLLMDAVREKDWEKVHISATQG